MTDTIRCRLCGARMKAENETVHMGKVHPSVPFEPRAAIRPRTPRSRHLTSGTKKAIFAIALVAVLVSAGTILFRSVERGTPVDTSATVVRVSMSGFEPSSISVKAGALLKINVVNMDNPYHTDGGGWHNFAIDALSLNVTVEPHGQRVFTVPTDAAGTFGWYCSMCCGGRANPSMNGRLIVQP